MLSEVTSSPSDAIPDYVLRTFAFGLILGPVNDADAGEPNLAEPPCGHRWECVKEPSQLAGTHGFLMLYSGGHSCLGITTEGDVHRWDAGGGGANSLERGFCVEWSLSILKDEAGQRMQLRDASLGRPPVNSSSDHIDGAEIEAVALMDTGDVCSMSCGRQRGPVGYAGGTWQPVPGLQSQLVVNVACGSGFCVALAAPGELWAWGESEYGALGFGYSQSGSSQHQRTSTPQPVRGGLAGKHVAAVACGDHHVIAAIFDDECESGPVFSWGCDADNRLGYNVDGGVQNEPRVVPWITPTLGHGSNSGTLSQRRGLRMPQRITQVGCGVRHSVILCQGSIICFGADDCGQLGRPFIDQQNSSCSDAAELPCFAHAPALTPALLKGNCGSGDDVEINASVGEVTARRICCGPFHTAAVSSEGALYVWGLNLTCTPAEGQTQNTSGVRCVPGFGAERLVVALACGPHFVIVSAEVELLTVSESESTPVEIIPPPQTLRASWRPENLPPKGNAELSRHQYLVRELGKHVQRQLDAEERLDEQRRANEMKRERRLREHTDIWLREFLPKIAEDCRRSVKMERMWRQGLPPRVREVLWPWAIGNVLRVTPELFEIHSQRAREARENWNVAKNEVLLQVSDVRNNISLGREQSFELIPYDLPRTFPTLAFFSEGGPLYDDCAHILEAYTFYRPDIGYVQGMSYLAATLLLYLPVYPAFVGFCNLINTPSILGLYRMERSAVECRASLFTRLLESQLPAVAQRLETVGFKPEMFLIDWFMTLYTKCLPIDTASVVWDLFLVDGEVVLYCVALALMRLSESVLLSDACLELEGCAYALGEGLRHRMRDPDEIVSQIQEIWRHTPSQLLSEIRRIENDEFSAANVPERHRPPGQAQGLLARLTQWATQ